MSERKTFDPILEIQTAGEGVCIAGTLALGAVAVANFSELIVRSTPEPIANFIIRLPFATSSTPRDHIITMLAAIGGGMCTALGGTRLNMLKNERRRRSSSNR
jgi:hypothetical protein